jgi:hypothetical protein
MKIFVALLPMALFVGCSDSQFAGSSNTIRSSLVKQQKAEPAHASGNDATPAEDSTESPQGAPPVAASGAPAVAAPSVAASAPVVIPEPSGLHSGALGIDYQICKSGAHGNMRYNAKCPANSVVVAINDGMGQEMTCCPVSGQNIFSNNPNDLWIPRTGQCAGDEVGTGMISADNSAIYCSKLNPKLGIKQTVSAVYVGPQAQVCNRNGCTSSNPYANLSPELADLASVYHLNDLCFCPAGSILIGGHTGTDNICRDRCVQVGIK